jgi:hypothetical protein
MADNFTIYGLSDPRQPAVLKYIGQTAVHYRKRGCDHVAQAKFRLKRNIKMPPVMQWILELDAEGLEPVTTPLFFFEEREEAVEAERYLVTHPNINPYLLNIGSYRGGRPPQRIDGRNKRAPVPKMTRPAATQQAWETSAANRRLYRAFIGAPHPEVGLQHPLNRPWAYRTPRITYKEWKELT